MNKLTRFLLLSLISLSTLVVNANIKGAEITYKTLDSCRIEVTVVYYRYCSGSALLPPAAKLECISSSGGVTQTADLDLKASSIHEITPYCESSGPECSPTNTPVTSSTGSEQHTFKDTIDLCGTDSLFSLCNTLRVTTRRCCRNSTITTGAANNQFFNYSDFSLSKAPSNASPIFTNDPIIQLCCNQPYYTNFGALDTVDFDSISYAWSLPLSNMTSSISYTSTQSPFSFFTLPGNNQTNPTNDPPVGLFLNPQTGNVIFTPTNCSERTVAVIEATEWRKNSSGNYEIIGITRRDLEFTVTSCPDNNPPIINGPISYNVCEGDQLCFNITTSDNPVIPPPPTLVPPADTVNITWNGGISDATFNVINVNARLQTGQFCWTPPVGSSSSLPYTFTATARDDACPRNAVSTRAFSITVKPRVQATQTTTDLGCGTFALSASADTAAMSQSSLSVSRILYDTLGLPIVNTNINLFSSTQNALSNTAMDTLRFFKNGTYVLRTTLNNPSNCPKVVYDTLIISGIPEIELNASISYCANVAFTISSNLISTNNAAYAWYKNNVPLNGETDSILFVPPRPSASQDKYKVVAVSGGCTIQNTRIIPSLYNDVNSLPETEEACQGDIVKLNLDTFFSNIEWSTGSISNAITLNGSDTVYVTYVDSLGCVYTDSVEVVFNPLPSPILDDDTSCTSSLKLSSGMFSSYTWSTGDTTKDIVVSKSGQYSISVIDSNGCTNTSTANIVLGSTPQYSLKDTITGCDKVTLTATPNTTVSWSTGDTTASISLFQSGNISATLVSLLGCDTTISTYVSVINSPVLNLGNDTTFCADSFILNANAGQLFLWNTGEQSQTILIDQTGSYWVQASQGGCVSTDTIEVTLNSNSFVPQIVRTGNTINSNLIGRHQWYRDGALVAGETVSAINIANRPGRYRALHQDQNGCFSDSSNAVNVTLGIAGVSIKDIKIYPNPSNGKITIDAAGLGNVQGIKLYDTNGKLVENTQTINGSLVNLSWEALSGIYWVVVTTDKGVYRAEVVNVR